MFPCFLSFSFLLSLLIFIRDCSVISLFPLVFYSFRGKLFNYASLFPLVFLSFITSYLYTRFRGKLFSKVLSFSFLPVLFFFLCSISSCALFVLVFVFFCSCFRCCLRETYLCVMDRCSRKIP